MSKQEGQLYEFGPYRLLPGERLLLRNGEPVALTPKAFDTLVALVQRAGHLADKDELLKAVWPDSFVEESNLAQNVFALRRALGESENGKPYIETVPKRGYRFLASVRVFEDQGEELLLQHHVRAQLPKVELTSVSEDEELAIQSSNVIAPQATHRDQALVDREKPKSLWKPSSRFLVPAALLAFVGIAVSIYFVWLRRTPQSAATAERSIAILPFKNLGPDANDEYLGLGVTDALITKLSNVRQIVVRPTSSVLRYGSQQGDISAAGRELRVETVLAGGVQRAGDHVRVTVQLVRADDGKSLWAETYDADFKNIFQVQDEISSRVVQALKVQLTGSERELLAKRPTGDLEAYQLYLRGNYHIYRFTPEDFQKAIRHFNEAIVRDPAYALAYAGLANAYGITSAFGDDEASSRGEAAAAKAVKLDPTLAEAHASFAAIKFWQKRDAHAAQDSFNRALELNPNSAVINHYYAWFLVATARFDDAERYMRRALELDPLSPSINVDQGLPFYYARRYKEAQARYVQALDLDANYGYAHLRLGEASEGLGNSAQAVSEFERTAALSKGDGKAQLARALALAGRKDEATRLLSQITAKDSGPRTSPYYVALAYAALEERDEAFAWLERALVEKDKWLGWINVDPRLDSIRSDPRFNNLLQRFSRD